MMEYKGYLGTAELDQERGTLHGEVVNTRDVITFQGQSVAEVIQAFRDSIDDYLDFCKARGESPERPCSGRFVTRIPPELHRKAIVAATQSGLSLNAWVTDQLRAAVTADGTKIAASTAKPTETKKAGVSKPLWKRRA